jgi:hypothetical protein
MTDKMVMSPQAHQSHANGNLILKEIVSHNGYDNFASNGQNEDKSTICKLIPLLSYQVV